MRYEYIEPFVFSTLKVLDCVLSIATVKGNHTLVQGGAPKGDLTIIIKIGGDSEGTIILNMDTETALKLCNWMNESDFESLTPLGMDVISELANMIAGNATSLLNDLGYSFKVSPPLILTQDSILETIPNWETFQIPLVTGCGEITMNIALRTN
jgi:chemotaxis protein CheX